MAPPKGSGTRATGTPASQDMSRQVLQFVKPCRGWLIVVFVAMLIATAMNIAAPCPLKIIVDNAGGKQKLPEFLTRLRGFSSGESTMTLAGVAACGAVLIVLVPAVAGYTDNCCTESVVPYVADDLRQRLSVEYYDTHRIGNMLSTITAAVSTISEADQLVVLKGGYVAEKGTQDELIQRGELYRIQAGSTPPPETPAGNANQPFRKP